MAASGTARRLRRSVGAHRTVASLRAFSRSRGGTRVASATTCWLRCHSSHHRGQRRLRRVRGGGRPPRYLLFLGYSWTTGPSLGGPHSPSGVRTAAPIHTPRNPPHSPPHPSPHP